MTVLADAERLLRDHRPGVQERVWNRTIQEAQYLVQHCNAKVVFVSRLSLLYGWKKEEKRIDTI